MIHWAFGAVIFFTVGIHIAVTNSDYYGNGLKNLHRIISQMQLDSIVDANISAMHHVFHAGNPCPFQRKVMAKLQRRETVKIEILGGSSTFGADLKKKDEERWSNKLNVVMNGGWINSSNPFSIVNRAIPACNVDSWIYLLSRFKDADMVIVDLSVNDQGFDLPVLPLYYKTLIQLLDDLPNHPALLFVQMFRTSLQSKKEIDSVCPAEDKHGHCCNDIWWCKRWWDMQDYVTEALHKYKVPYVSYRDLVWPVYSQPPEHLNLFWNGYSHPDYKNHALIGKLISYAMLRLIMQASGGHGSGESGAVVCKDNSNDRYVFGNGVDSSVQLLCSAPKVKMYATDAAALETFRPVPRAVNQGPSLWRYFNDSKEKYGWILEHSQEKHAANCSTQPIGCGSGSVLATTVISFEVEFGSSPVLQVTYLKSWSEDMGTALLWIDDKINQTVLLPAYWKDEYSVSHYTTITPFKMTNVSAIVLGENFVLPTLSPGRHVVNIAANSLEISQYFTHGSTVLTSRGIKKFKWKLLGLTSC